MAYIRNDFTPDRLDIEIFRNDDPWQRELQAGGRVYENWPNGLSWRNQGGTARLQVREYEGAQGKPLIDTAVICNGWTFQVSVPRSAMIALPAGSYVYNIMLARPAGVDTVYGVPEGGEMVALFGTALIRNGVTR